MSEPPRRQDPLALAVLGGAVALIAAIAIYLFFSIRSQPEPAGGKSWVEEARGKLRKLFAEGEKAVREARREAQPAAPKPPPAAKPPRATAGSKPTGRLIPEAGRSWRYAVKVEPEIWKDITLTYRTTREANALGVQTEFRYAGGQSAFRLGVFAPNHPSHANTRFPGFFMHAAYFQMPLETGQQLSWGWPWQASGPSVREGRVKRYQATVERWENVEVPAGSFSAARIAATLSYVDEGRVQATARETLWYAPNVFQVVKVVREGRTPDESATRIVAELAEYH